MCSENDRVDVVDASLATLLSELIFGFTAAGAVKVELKRPSRPLPNAVDGMLARISCPHFGSLLFSRFSSA